MLPGMELMGCTDLAVPPEVMHHVVRVESSYNPFAIGVVGGRLVRQPRNLPEAVATAHMLESRGFNFSLGLAQINRYNLKKYGIGSYETAFQACPNLTAGARILAECYSRSKNDWGDSLSCYYSGNFVTGYRHGYVQKVFASMGATLTRGSSSALAIEVASRPGGTARADVTRLRSTSTTVDTAAQELISIRSSELTSSRASRARQLGAAGSVDVAAQRSSLQQQVASTTAPEAAFQARQAQPDSGVRVISKEPSGMSSTETNPNTDGAFVF